MQLADFADLIVLFGPPDTAGFDFRGIAKGTFNPKQWIFVKHGAS
jgi:hypothetical protein